MGNITKQSFFLGKLYLLRNEKHWSMFVANAGIFSPNDYQRINVKKKY